MYQSERIFLHGMFMHKVVKILFLQPWLLKKCSWIIWGGDLYSYKNKRNTFKSKLYERIRSFVIRYMGGLITQVQGDYDLAVQWYGAQGKYCYSFSYPSNLYEELDLADTKKDPFMTYIQVGNSADPTNNHIEVFRKLEKYKDQSIKIICPLSYGNFSYRDRVIQDGSRVFGDKFIPITDYMPYEEYLKVLAKIDVAIFNHNRQQALGNITKLLGFGKKVYIRDDITTWGYMEKHHLQVYSINHMENSILEPMCDDIRTQNIQNVKTFFSEEKLKSDLEMLFSS